MATRTMRQSLMELKESILIDNKDSVVIPAKLLIELLSTHATIQDTFTKTTETFSDVLEKFSLQTEKTTEALDRISIALETLNYQRQDDFHISLLQKLDELSKSISSNIVQPSVFIQTNMKTYAKKRKEILSKTIRAEMLSQYYSELISADKPFVPRKFRTKVSHTTPEFEKPVHKEDSIYKVSLQIKLMDERIKNWRKDLLKLETDMNLSIQSMDTDDREKFLANIAKGDEAVKKDRIKSIERLWETYTKEMGKENVDPDLFLLTYVGKPHQRCPKNVRSHPTQWRGRGKGWQKD